MRNFLRGTRAQVLAQRTPALPFLVLVLCLLFSPSLALLTSELDVLIDLCNALQIPSLMQCDTLDENRACGSPSQIWCDTSAGTIIKIIFQDAGLKGTLPDSLGNLTAIEDILLKGNGLSGTIPASLGKLKSLIRLQLFDNQLTGSIPPELGNLTNIGSLYFSNNPLNGTIPDFFHNMSQLYELGLGGSNITGTIPESIGSCTELIYIFLDNAPYLTGSLPASLVNLPVIQKLNFDNCNYTGWLPYGIGNTSSLIYFGTSYNPYLEAGCVIALPTLNDLYSSGSVCRIGKWFQWVNECTTQQIADCEARKPSPSPSPTPASTPTSQTPMDCGKIYGAGFNCSAQQVFISKDTLLNSSALVIPLPVTVLPSTALSLTGALSVNANVTLEAASEIALTGQSSSLFVNGDLFVSGDSALHVELAHSNSTNSTISITKCVRLNGTLDIYLTNLPTTATQIKVIDYSCIDNRDKLNVIFPSASSDCQTRSYDAGSQSVLVTVTARDCLAPSSRTDVIPGVSYEGSLAIVIVIPIAVALLVVVIIFAVPSIRMRVMPYRERQKVYELGSRSPAVKY